MTAPTTAPTTPPATAPPLPAARLAWLHLRYQVLETVRVPIAVLGNLLFPALAMFFFVVPQREVAGDPVVATTAVAGLALFAVCSASLFTYGLGVAEDRQLPFDPFVRSLPVGAAPQLLARIGTGAAFAVLGVLPLVAIGAFLTEASVTLVRLVAGVGTLVLASVPFVLLGMAVGYSLSAKAALPVVQVLLFPLAFAGGLFLPPQLFPAWLDAVSQATPTRAARDLLVQALTGEPGSAWAWPVLTGWIALLAVLAVVAYRRDEGRRFR
ncbi:ABC transporter permease [Xylanimonas oleitrophica]|uniref:ABC transporter permease n=1 Tax=Xylanimonas oleitrophica TaxID=2607479 RepID=A0A2W5XTE6_9MICO|nr:ABC transporter permease [Xylanimonas oleitrophica]PZR53338.1 ABC transporter permease [Xylanimonas oleitrophica]